MKGIILAGGTGSRLYPLTKVTNKHLLPVGKFPMIHYPIVNMKNAGITDILIVSGTDHVGDMIAFLGSGSEYGCDFTFKVQDQPDGIAGALKLCKSFVGSDNFLVVLGDNIFEIDIKHHIDSFNTSAKFFFKRMENPNRFGVAVLNDDFELLEIEEKPSNPKSDLACMGIYMYTSELFNYVDDLKKSERMEYEVSDLNNLMIKNHKTSYVIMDEFCMDAGTMDSYHYTNKILIENDKRPRG
jgi:glucose-1-phosphate thymidylyltransferase